MTMNTDARTPTVLVLDRRGDFAKQLAVAAQGLDPVPEILRLARTTKVIDALDGTTPDVLVAAPTEMSHAGMRRLAQVHRAHPDLVILLSPNGVAVPVSEAAEAGVDDVLPYPSTPSRMRIKLRRALEWASDRREGTWVGPDLIDESDPAVEAEPPPEPQPEPEPEPDPVPRKTGTVVTVTSASGGCGKTFYATNFASYLAKATGGRVLLVDLDLQFGEVAVALQLRSERTIAELVDSDDVASDLPDYVVTHGSGFDVLCAPRDPVVAERVGPRETITVLEAAVQHYDHVVVDTPPSLNEVVLAAFDRSSSLIVMATLDVPSLRNLRVFLETLDRLKVPADGITLVLNKIESGTGIDVAQVERVYPQGFSTRIPYAREVTLSLNVGCPVVDAEPGATVSRALIDGARKIVGPADGRVLPWDGATPPMRGWLNKLFRR